MEKNRIKKEKSILGRINDLSHKLVLVLVIPIVLSLVLMLVYAGKYHNAIERMETIASIKTIVASDIPGSAWNIIIGRDDFASSKLYLKIHDVENTIEKITESTDSENSSGYTSKTVLPPSLLGSPALGLRRTGTEAYSRYSSMTPMS